MRIVFCIDPVGTVTACRIKVMPKMAMISVTTKDSKYSRIVDFGGPGLTAGFSISISVCSTLIDQSYAGDWLAVSLYFSSVAVIASKASLAAIISAAFI